MVSGRLLAALLGALIAQVFVALGGQLEDGLSAYQRGEYAAALDLLHPLAESGDAGAQNALGLMSFVGDGVGQDDAAAARWFRLAGEQSLPNAQWRLGNMYFNGWGVTLDLGLAASWYRKAADLGLQAAQQDLGNMYSNGWGVPHSLELSVQWFRKSNLKDGNAVAWDQDDLRYLSEAARRHRAAAGEGDPAAQFKLGLLYLSGRGVEQDRAEAAEWITKAAEQGVPDAQNYLAGAYLYGVGVSKDAAEALKWYRKAAEQGNLPAQLALGFGMRLGFDFPRDLAEAFKWFQAAADQGSGDAQFQLGSMYAAGQGVPRDLVQAYKWIDAARRNETSAESDRGFAALLLAEVAKELTPEQLAQVSPGTEVHDTASCRSQGDGHLVFPDRIWLRGFSVVPPVGPGWCVGDLSPFGSSVSIYREIPADIGAEKTGAPERAHSYFVKAELADVDGEPPGTSDELAAMAAKWTASGAVAATQLTGKTILRFAPSAATQRFTLRRGETMPDNSPGLECVRYDLSYEERGNSQFPELPLTIDAIGYLCLNPNSPDELIQLAYSERHASDWSPTPSLMQSLEAEAKAFVSSIWLEVPRDADALGRQTSAAQRGLAQPQFSVGLYQQIKKDYAAALDWYRLAAAQGHAAAQNNLGILYELGLGVAEDQAEAARWYRLAAEKGAAEAQFLLAARYFKGTGVVADKAEGLKWLHRAADQGFAIAQINMGEVYREGDGVPQDPVRAYVWCKLGLSRAAPGEEHDLAAGLLATMEKTLTPAQLAEGNARAEAWTPGAE